LSFSEVYTKGTVLFVYYQPPPTPPFQGGEKKIPPLGKGRLGGVDHSGYAARKSSGPRPMQLVVVMAVRKAVSAATNIFTATSIIFVFFIVP
jgi:hypothetical protein